jgi:XTP/dITP diphosphohydrolase
MLAGIGFNLINQTDTDIPSAVEDGATFVENALIKARSVAKATGLPCIADDSGLVVQALNGAPGIYSARYAGEDASDADNNRRLLEALSEQTDRRAFFFCCMVFLRSAQDPTPLIATAQWHGEILQAPRGDGGFGYDPLFWLPEHEQSAAQLPKATKNTISHRGQACAKLVAALHVHAIA